MVFKPRSGITTALDSVAYYYSPIGIYLSLPLISCLLPVTSPLTTFCYHRVLYTTGHCLSSSLPPPDAIYRYFRVSFRIYLSHASCKESARMALRTSSSGSCCHHGLLLHTPPTYFSSHAHISNIRLRATHWATVSCLQPMYVATIYIPYNINSSLAAAVTHVPSEVLLALFPATFFIKLTYFT